MRAMRDAVLMLDDSGTIVEANSAAEHLLGWRESDIVSKEIQEIFRPYELDGKKRLAEKFDHVLKRGLSWSSRILWSSNPALGRIVLCASSLFLSSVLRAK